MARRRKQFPCGHMGYGRYCHRCHQAEVRQTQQQRQKLELQRAKEEWAASFHHDPIDLKGLPPPIVLKARSIMASLAEGENYHQFRGKRLNHDRHIISIPLGRHYRLVCHQSDRQIVPKEVLSHEDYNATKPGT